MVPLFFCVVLLLVAVLLFMEYKKRKSQPPGPLFAWPFIGNALELGKVPHIKLMEMAKQYGPLVRLKLGSDLVIVLNDYESIKKLFSLDEAAGRPRNTITDVLMGNVGVVLSDGTLWKEHRRFALSALRDLGMGKSWLQEEILGETNHLIEALTAIQGQPVDPVHLLTITVSNIICAAAFGKRFDYDDQYFRDLLWNERQFIQQFNQVSLLDLMPSLRFVPPFRTWYEKRAKVIQLRLDSMDRAIEEAKIAGSTDSDRMDYVNVFLRERERQGQNGITDSTFDDEQLRNTIADLFGAGTETTSTTMLLGLLYLIENPVVHRRIQKELDAAASREEPILMHHRSQLPYFDATLLELFRMEPIVPLGVIHRTTAPVSLSGWSVPANTLLIPNIYAVHHDPTLWKNPEVFDPSRFLDSSGAFAKSPYVIPFSVGKRVCPGETLAQMELLLVFANILHKFDLVVPEGAKLSTKNVTVTVTTAPNPYKIIFKRRT